MEEVQEGRGVGGRCRGLGWGGCRWVWLGAPGGGGLLLTIGLVCPNSVKLELCVCTRPQGGPSKVKIGLVANRNRAWGWRGECCASSHPINRYQVSS